MQEGAPRGRAKRALSFVLQEGVSAPASDSVVIPGTTLVLTRRQATDVLVHNRLGEPTAIHWHGLELESYSDGVAGWSGVGANLAMPVAPGGRFLAHLSMPRAGAFIYHTHLRDMAQLTSGLYSAIVVLEPGHAFDTRNDHVHIVGWDAKGDSVDILVNGDSVRSPPIEARVGEAHRLRFINIGADLPSEQATMRPARLSIDVGETCDFEFKAGRPGDHVLSAPVWPKGATWSRHVVVR